MVDLNAAREEQVEAQSARILALEAEMARLRAALAKILPIRVEDGQDYAEVFFADGVSHSTQAMTVNPQDWLDIAALASGDKPHA
jgi:hypothetical protein